MEVFLPVLIFGVIGVIIFVGIVIHHQMEQKRSATITEIANDLGLTFIPAGDPGLQNRLSHFDLLRQGRRRKLRNALVGATDEVQLALFDYEYTVTRGKNTHTYRQTVAAIESPQLAIPPFTMRPESLFDALGSMLGFQDIDFEAHPEFSKAFVVKSPQEHAVRDFLDQPILDYFASHQGISVEADQGQMIFYRGGKRAKPEELKNWLSDAYEVYCLLMDRQNRDQTTHPASDPRSA